MVLVPLRPADSAWPALAEEHLALVDEALCRLHRRLPDHVDRDDLAGAGRVALVQAARQYDPDRGPFPAFAARRLSGAMLDELRRGDWASRSVRQHGRRRDAGTEVLAAQLGRTPTREEIADAVGLSEADLRRHEADARRAAVTSLDALRESGEDHAGDDLAPEDVLLAGERAAHLHEAMATLPPRTRRVLQGRFLEERPVREIADELHVSDSRVSQMCAEGVTALRESLAGYLHGDVPTGDRPWASVA